MTGESKRKTAGGYEVIGRGLTLAAIEKRPLFPDGSSRIIERVIRGHLHLVYRLRPIWVILPAPSESAAR